VSPPEITAMRRERVRDPGFFANTVIGRSHRYLRFWRRHPSRAQRHAGLRARADYEDQLTRFGDPRDVDGPTAAR
jgi:hypothetical protein